ncbi:MAG: hypothetical protein ACFFAN_05710 [Promethearchaeota archaeon]
MLLKKKIRLSDLRKNQETIDNSSLENIDNTLITQSMSIEAFSLEQDKKGAVKRNIYPLQINKRARKEYFVLIQDICNILLHCKDLTNQEKFELCTRERSQIKAYLKEVLKKC